MKHLFVKDFAKFQHYRDRNPPWIKLYTAVLNDAAFLQMPEAAQAQLMKLWVLAAQLGHPLPNNPKLLAGRIGATGRFHLATIIAAGFLVPGEESDAPSLAPVEQNASASVRARGERTEGELESASHHDTSDESATAIAELAHLLTEVPGATDALTGFMEGLPSSTKRLTWARSLITSLHPIGGGKPVNPVALVAAMADFNLSDRSRFPHSGAVFRAFVDKAARDLDTAAIPISRGSAVPHRENWTEKKTREDNEESDRQLARVRAGNVDTRRGAVDGSLWYARMQREAKALGKNVTLYAYDRMHEPAEVAAHA